MATKAIQDGLSTGSFGKLDHRWRTRWGFITNGIGGGIELETEMLVETC